MDKNMIGQGKEDRQKAMGNNGQGKNGKRKRKHPNKAQRTGSGMKRRSKK